MGGAGSEVRTESIPKQQTCGDGHSAEDPKLPTRSSMSQQFAGIADTIKRSRADVGAVGDQAESGEKPREIRRGQSERRRNSPQRDRQGRTDDRPCPYDGQRMPAVFPIGVREMTVGYTMTFSTVPPVSQAPATWPNSCTACIASHESKASDTIRLICRNRAVTRLTFRHLETLAPRRRFYQETADLSGGHENDSCPS
jgi:hypothetical protein